MVLIESDKSVEIKSPEAQTMNPNEHLDVKSPVQKLYSCEELERSIGSQLTVLSQSDTMQKSTEELKQVDPAIMSCSSKTKLTRYTKQELMDLKASKLSQEMPKCFSRPEILKLNILEQGQMPQNRPFNFNASYNPGLNQFIADYNRIMLSNPLFNFYKTQYDAIIDKIPPYDRTNFYDQISNNAMRPPPMHPRMGVNSLGQAYPNRYANNNGFPRKPNVGGYDRFNGCSENDINKSSSSDGSMIEKPHVDKRNEPYEKQNEGESEPEWYTAAATVDDIVDLHGFEEGELENMPQPKVAQDKTEKGYGTPSLAYRRSGYNQNRNLRNNFNNGYNQNANVNNQQGFNNNLRFRNPLHFNKQPHPNMHNQNWQNPINPFFDMWQRTRMVPGEVSNINSFMQRQRGPMQPNMPPMNDVESSLRASNYLSSLMNQNQMQMAQQQQQMQNIPIGQFFNNWPQQQASCMAQAQNAALNMPTQEQLQMHTTEIMRNAILRKNQQQFH